MKESVKKTAEMDRRDFLGWLGRGMLGLSGLLGFLGLGRYLGYQPDPPPQAVFDLGPASQYPPGTSTPLPEAQAVLLSSGSAYRAISLVCPHLGCLVQQEGQEYACPCHGSRFALDGSLLNGPADQPLRQLNVEVASNGHLLLDTRAS